MLPEVAQPFGIAGLGEPAPETVYPAMYTVARFALVPLAVAALATGLLQVLVTGNGLRRHWWATAKLVITVVLATVAVFVVVPGWAGRPRRPPHRRPVSPVPSS